MDNGTEVAHLIVVYAAPTVGRRSGLWGQLKAEIENVDAPLIVGGDFNTIVRLDERTGGNGRLSLDSLAFGEWINELSLIDMGFKGNKFTWRRGRVESTFVAKRLDRILCCAHARLKWQEAVVTHLPVMASDHAPLYLQLSPEAKGNPERRPFRFEAAWLNHPGFKDLLANSWRNELSTPEALEGLRVKLRQWNKEVFGDINKKKETLLQDIKGIQDLLEVTQSDALLNQEESLLKELDVVLEQEEILWFQKSREKWIELGDRNTKYFHTSTIIRRRRNRIEMLKNNDGAWISDPTELENLAVGYYQRLYSMEDIDHEMEVLSPAGFVDLSRAEVTELSKPFSSRDVEESVRSMGKLKAPGPDGYQPIFYQKNWDVVGESGPELFPWINGTTFLRNRC